MNKKKEETNIQNKKTIKYLKYTIGLLNGLLNCYCSEKLKVVIHNLNNNPTVEIKTCAGKLLLIESNPPYSSNKIVQSLMGRPTGY